MAVLCLRPRPHNWLRKLSQFCVATKAQHIFTAARATLCAACSHVVTESCACVARPNVFPTRWHSALTPGSQSLADAADFVVQSFKCYVCVFPARLSSSASVSSIASPDARAPRPTTTSARSHVALWPNSMATALPTAASPTPFPKIASRTTSTCAAHFFSILIASATCSSASRAFLASLAPTVVTAIFATSAHDAAQLCRYTTRTWVSCTCSALWSCLFPHATTITTSTHWHASLCV